jgi:four helix bundle protein
MRIESAKDLTVYKFAYELAMEIFEFSKNFPPEEKYALTTQIRRSSRSVCLNLREAWAKRRYEAHFLSKLTDCDGETAKRIRHSISLEIAPTSLASSMRNSPENPLKLAGCSAG